MLGGGHDDATEDTRHPQPEEEEEEDEERGRGACIPLPRAQGLFHRKMSSKATLALLIYGIFMQHSAGSGSQLGLPFPHVTLEGELYDEDGNSLPPLDYDGQEVRSPPMGTQDHDVYSPFYPPPDKRTERHADGMFNKAYRKALGQLSARKYLHSLMAKRIGGGRVMEDNGEPLSKRHSDGIFTDSYSRYRKQMAVKKYLAAVLGKRLEDVDLSGVDFDALLDREDFEAFGGDWLKLLPPKYLVLPSNGVRDTTESAHPRVSAEAHQRFFLRNVVREEEVQVASPLMMSPADDYITQQRLGQ